MKYKLRGDYPFYTKSDEPLRNKFLPNGNVSEYVIIDDKKCDVSGQLHKLEVVVEKEKAHDQTGPKSGDTKQPPTQYDGGAKKNAGK